jgi:hypothetical protein
LLFFLGFTATRSLEVADNAPEPEVLLSATRLEQHSLTLVSSSPLVVEGQTLGEVLLYVLFQNGEEKDRMIGVTIREAIARTIVAHMGAASN